MKDKYPKEVNTQIQYALMNALSFPPKIGDFMDANKVTYKGMNYLANPELLGKAIRSLGFGLVTYKDEFFTSAGNATSATTAYFGQMLKDLKGST